MGRKGLDQALWIMVVTTLLVVFIYIGVNLLGKIAAHTNPIINSTGKTTQEIKNETEEQSIDNSADKLVLTIENRGTKNGDNCEGVEIKVTDGNGNPIENAHIYSDESGSWKDTSKVTDANGKVTLDIKSGVNIKAWKQNYIMSDPKQVSC